MFWVVRREVDVVDVDHLVGSFFLHCRRLARCGSAPRNTLAPRLAWDLVTAINT